MKKGKRNDGRPWYEARGGLRFRCTQCGKCCKTPGIVALHDMEAHAIAARLEEGATAESLTDAPWVWDVDYNAWLIHVEEGESCPLLGPDGCRVHDIKPEQCATYPFWDETLEAPYFWYEEGIRCEGIQPEGDLYTPDLIETIRTGRRFTNENI